MTSGSGGLNPSAVAGGPSVTRLTQRSWTGMSPSGQPMVDVKKMERTSPMLENANGGAELRRNAHDALSDARMCGQIFFEYRRRFPNARLDWVGPRR